MENIGTRAQTFDGSAQTLIGADDRRYSADATAAIYLEDSQSFLTQVNPGNAVDGIVVFDISLDATLVGIELHDSLFSGVPRLT
ncbi:DUF4352 domain-containing protein [Streptomyces justiciae]|uniref:DUF4352 domain-containing protein n=1 Tax=Streptomyces justiciae TaxID=2780140 RepID=A0ABU3M6N3_9ACTN|nr:DUF4352 domain-containing protein [Streptomyces justiciae]MDT7846998.1 DUF4352 domain-containing protein [Streptomyces justiciae]